MIEATPDDSGTEDALKKQLQARWETVRAALDQACLAAGREPATVDLLPVSKTFGAPIVVAAAALGWRRFGENRVQELRDKQAALAAGPTLDWVLIGHLQSNKLKLAASLINEIQSLDSAELAEGLDRQLQARGRSLRVLLQVKTAREPGKHGIVPAALPTLYQRLSACPSLQLQGLMTVATHTEDTAEVRRCFAELRHCRDRLQEQAGFALPRLSMGMSGDYPLAIAEGATEVRIGTAIFGVRSHSG